MKKTNDEIIEEYSNIAQNLREDLQAVFDKYNVQIAFDEGDETNIVMYKGVEVDWFINFAQDFLDWTPFNK